jgi:NAD(P)-dependent dehydrogenase (short-subunit alcohol dehydrogenase family)
MKIQGSVALVTGSNRGLGKALVSALLEAGAPRVYAAMETDFDTNVFGTLAVVKGFLPVLERAPGGTTIVNVLSLASLGSFPALAGYSASKAASYSITQALRPELRRKRIEILAAFPGRSTPTQEALLRPHGRVRAPDAIGRRPAFITRIRRRCRCARDRGGGAARRLAPPR